MRCEACAVEPYSHVPRDISEHGSVRKRFGGQAMNVDWANVSLRLHKRVPRLKDLPVEIHRHDCDLDNPVRVVDAGGLTVDHGDAVGAARQLPELDRLSSR
jgi:hypothetical protein